MYTKYAKRARPRSPASGEPRHKQTGKLIADESSLVENEGAPPVGHAERVCRGDCRLLGHERPEEHVAGGVDGVAVVRVTARAEAQDLAPFVELLSAPTKGDAQGSPVEVLSSHRALVLDHKAVVFA